MNKIKEQAFTFQFKGIEILETRQYQATQPLPDVVTYNFDISIEHRFNNEHKLVIVIVAINIKNEANTDKFGAIKIACTFSVTNFDDFVNNTTKQPQLPEPIVGTLNSISLSTTRGVMFSHFKGTALHNAILPVVDPKNFISAK